MRREFDIFLTALMFFTRIPIPNWIGYTYQPSYLQQSSRHFSLIGWIVGSVAVAVYMLAIIWLPITVSVILSMGTTILLTGAFHEDGWADMWDGFGGGITAAHVLEIMKDSRLGTYGTVALIFILSTKAATLITIGATTYLPIILIAGHTISRLMATTLIYTHDYVHENHHSKAKPLATSISGKSLTYAMIVGLFPIIFLPPITWLILIPMIIIRTMMARWFVRRLGGYSGDCLGGVQQATELTFYICIIPFLL